MNDNRLRYIFVISTTFLTAAILVLFFQYSKVLNTAIANIENIKRKDVHNFSKNIELYLKNHLENSINSPFKITKEEQEQGNSMLSLFSGYQYPYIYIISKDKTGKYRYIFDGSKSEQGEYLQKFDPAELSTWEKAWNTKTPQWKSQNTINGLWVTYLYPIISQNRTKLIIAFDFSSKERILINSVFMPIKHYLFAIAIMLMLFMFLIYLFGYLFYQQRKKAYKDSLTKLYNRHYLDSISNSINLDNITIAIIDLDHFKRVNDTYGHNVGDEVLKSFSLKLQEIIRPDDILIRYGGEEFLLFLQKDKNSNKQQLEESIKSIQNRVSNEHMYTIDGNKIKISISIGFNSTPYLNRSLDDAILIADKMLYVAKTSGRNRVEIFREERLNDCEVFGPREVMQALNEQRLVAYFQPIASAKDNKIVKYEALIRLVDREKNIIPPIKFLPNIKSNTAYRAMSKFMLEQTFFNIKKHNISISINFDLGDFLDETLYELIYDMINSQRELASKLSIELLEDREIDDFSKLNDKILNLQKLGVSIAVDDFGTGYSTFSYLLALNPNILKIDGFLIRELSTNSQARSIVTSIVTLCKELDIQVIAEFVSDERTKKIAKELGINYLQGYAIGRPSPNIN